MQTLSRWKLAKWCCTGAGGRWEGSRAIRQSCPADGLQWVLVGCQSQSFKASFLPFPLPLQKERIREKFVAALQREFAGKGLRFSRGELLELPWLCPGLFTFISHRMLGEGAGILAIPSRGLETLVRAQGASLPWEPSQGHHSGIHSRE